MNCAVVHDINTTSENLPFMPFLLLKCMTILLPIWGHPCLYLRVPVLWGNLYLHLGSTFYLCL
ncbi:hypothetical protein BS47DRAFT_857043 [Hydnum rufescens UP504]|uniref:Uncharacterized protein n=1 Tax=Hydnum rufescens UP504 TaxID=1448309 RepID=A0A9P6AZR4_9AGAM|nr:hypothetical protein BS47DRAFT_857043 [Hydnum rufescens UP504]